MRALIAAISVVLLIAITGYYLLDSLQEPSYRAFVSEPTMRITTQEAGHNLVGIDWSSSQKH